MKIPLNFGWGYAAHFQESFLTSLNDFEQVVDLPHNINILPFSYFNEEKFIKEATYAKEINVKEINKTTKFVLVFDGVSNGFTLFINGHEVGIFVRPYMEEQIDITPFLQIGVNLLVVKVDGTETVNSPPFGHNIDFLPFPGIYREVSLLVYNELELVDLQINAFASGEVKLQPRVFNPLEQNYTLTYEIYEDKALIHTATSEQFSVDNVHLWSVNDPYLYYLRVILKNSAGKAVNHYGYNIGFRDILFTRKGFYLNNVLTPLVGLNRHETFPYIGGAATSYLQYNDVIALKKLGVNYVRCSHYPPSTHFLNACDFLGLLVINEVPGWQYIGDKAWQERHLQNIETMIRRDYNHPSIISWSIRINESVDHDELYTAGHLLAKSLDPYRPTTGTRNIKHSNIIEDIYSYNDFSHNGKNRGLEKKSRITKTKKPYIVSENNGHMFPTKPYDSPTHQIEHTKRHLAVLNSFFKQKEIIAISPWCMHDYYTHNNFGAGDHICYHGVLDINRQLKSAAYVYKANLSSEPFIYPLLKFDFGDLAENHPLPIMVLSNAHSLVLEKEGKVIKSFSPDTSSYPYLPNPPFIIDTLITKDTLVTRKPFSNKHQKTLARILNYVAFNNFSRLRLHHKISLLPLIIKYKLGYSDFVDLWNDNVALSKNNKVMYTLKGLDAAGQEIASLPLSKTVDTTYEFELTKDILQNGETYDMTTINIASMSTLVNIYDFSSVFVTTSGPIRLCGPTTQSLHAGQLTLYFCSLNAKGKATVSVSVNNITKSFDLSVK